MLEIIFMIAVILLPIVGWWRIFLKSGNQGWKCLIPVYNLIIFLRIIKQPSSRIFWYILCFPFMIPFVFLLAFDSWRLMAVFGQNDLLYEMSGKKGWIVLLLVAPILIGQNIIYLYLGFPFIAFNKDVVYKPEIYD